MDSSLKKEKIESENGHKTISSNNAFVISWSTTTTNIIEPFYPNPHSSLTSIIILTSISNSNKNAFTL